MKSYNDFCKESFVSLMLDLQEMAVFYGRLTRRFPKNILFTRSYVEINWTINKMYELDHGEYAYNAEKRWNALLPLLETEVERLKKGPTNPYVNTDYQENIIMIRSIQDIIETYNTEWEGE